MLKQDIRKYIIRPTLQACDLWSDSAELLVYGTGLVETDYQYLVQIGNPKNGGIGFFSQQPDDQNDLIKAVMFSHYVDKILKCCGYVKIPDDPFEVASNLKFAVIMCRLHYARYEEAIPKANDALGMSQYHKKYYNGGNLGKANVETNTRIFQGAIDEQC